MLNFESDYGRNIKATFDGSIMIIDNRILTELLYRYRNSEKKMILLDYDGTLVDYKPKPEQAIPSAPLLDILRKLSGKEKTEVIIISGREHHDIEPLLGSLPIDIIAGHGAMMKKDGIWKTQVSEDLKWKEIVRPLLDQMASKCPESFVEDKYYSLAWHYRNSGTDSGYRFSRELIENVENLVQEYQLKILDGKKVVEILPAGIGKGAAVKQLLATEDHDFILAIGDDVTDEEIFAVFLNDKSAVTIKVGDSDSIAKYRLNTVNDVVILLNHLSE